jgi:hypothetical protein
MRLGLAVVWVLCGGALAYGLFWELLQVPESSVWMLGLSCTIALLIVIVLLWTAGGIFALYGRPQSSARVALVTGLGHAVAVIVGALVFLAAWWATSALFAWHSAYGGQLDAWIIARSGKSETKWLHELIDWAIWVLRWGIGLTLALSLAAEVTAEGRAAFGRARWLGRALHPGRWLVVALLVALLQFLPWHYVNWRPARLTLGMEPWFVGAKLTIVTVLSAIGAVLAVRIVTPENDRGSHRPT